VRVSVESVPSHEVEGVTWQNRTRLEWWCCYGQKIQTMLQPSESFVVVLCSISPCVIVACAHARSQSNPD
jgi:hypothetical protein